MELKVRISDWDAGVPVVMLRKKTAEKLGVHPKQRVLVQTISKKPKQTYAIVDIFEKVLEHTEIAISAEVRDNLKAKIGQKLEVTLASPPKSLEYIKEKLNHRELNEEKIKIIIEDIVANTLSEAEISLFVSAMYDVGMSFNETIFLIKSMLAAGQTLSFRSKYVADKHCIGGIPGNRTTPLVVAICASQGMIMPKTSSRAITSAAGTSDTVETIAKVDFSIKELKKIVEKTNACMVWGGGLGMVSSDDKIISIEKDLKIDPEAQLLASIMAKKLAVGSKYILIDIPYGSSAKVSIWKALRLRRKFERIGKYFKVKVKVVITDGNSPIGRGVGPILEMIDILKILDPERRGPKDLEDKAIFLAGQLFEMTNMCKKGKGKVLARYALESGKAFSKFKEIIEAQEGKIKPLQPGKYLFDLIAKSNSSVKKINNKKINLLARALGCPLDKASGIYFHRKVGEKVVKGDKILTLYAESKPRLLDGIAYLEREKPVEF